MFNGYEYVFADPGDHTYSDTDGTGTGTSGDILEGSAAANQWQSQWSGYNRLYYEPSATYTPWPTFTDADPNTPRSDPAVSGNTLNLSALWHDFGEPLMSVDALRNAGAIFVDNKDTEAGQGLADEIIMDNVAANNDILWDGQNFGSFSATVTGGTTTPPAWVAATSSTTGNTDFETNYLYSPTSTSARSRTYTATWSFTGIPSGAYDVYAWWVANNSNNTSAAIYSVNGVDVLTRSQRTDGGRWNLIASDQNFPGAGTVSVRLTNPSNSAKRLCADAVKLVPKFPAAPPVLFEKTGPVSSLANQGWQLNITPEAYKRPQDPNPTYYYTNAVGTFTATWTANNLNPAQLYDVYAVWAQGGTNRYAAVPYTTYHSAGTSVYYANQQLTLGAWTKIAGGDEGITFTGGVGRVVLNRTTTSSTSGRACADAVAFVPHGSVSIKIHRAHYYTQNANGTFLVDIDGGAISYYRFTDANNEGIVQGNELRRLDTAEATAAGIVTGRTYSQERQNFANWYSFYRRRELTAKNAISKVITDMQGVYIGLLSIHYGDSYGGIRQYALPVRVTIDDVLQDQSATLLTTLFSMDSNGGTPLRIGLKNTGEYFKGAYGKPSPLPSTNFSDESYPFFIADKGGACQQAFAIVMTDGYWNESYSGVGNADGDADTAFDGPPFADEASNTLADVAMHYYERDLNSALNNDVPINARDSADHQHLVTYTLSFGVEGSVDQDAYPDCPLGACPSPWPTPVANQLTTVDDLYHAAVNGRGKYVNASTPQEMVDAMNALKQDIESRLGSSAALATSSIQRQVGTMIYQGTYNTAGWFGEVNAMEIDVETGAVSEPVWQASQHVPEWDTRKIFSYDGSSGIVFEFNNISDAQEALLANRGYEPAHVVDFIRGDTSRNASYGGPFRVRTQPIGDFIHSAPTYYKGMIYIGSNDGMLHAIDASNGHEVFCYVPALVYDHLSDLAVPGYSHRYYVDGTAAVGDVNGSDILVCGLGKGGKGYFALDVSDPQNMAADKVLWEFPSTTDNDMGYAFSQAIIANTEAAGKVVIFGNGYDSTDQKAVLYIVNPLTGELIKKIDTLTSGCNGIATPKVVDMEGDGYADYAFAGDLLGNMWKFDLRGPSTADWKVYYQAGSVPQPLISVRNGDGDIQSITVAPEVMFDCADSPFARSGKGLMVIFGTGKYLNSSDFSDTSTQSFYGIWDWGDIWEARSGYETAQTKYLGTLNESRQVSNVSGKSLQEQVVISDSSGWVTLSANTVDWFDPLDTSGDPGAHMGWFFDLPGVGERGIREPMLRMGVAVLISIIPSESPCEAGGSSILYMVSACTGGRTAKPQFDLNNDDDFGDEDLINDLPPTGKRYEEILFEGTEISDTLYFSSSQADVTPEDVPPNLVGIQFWRVLQ
jgi:hypothetical protein